MAAIKRREVISELQAYPKKIVELTDKLQDPRTLNELVDIYGDLLEVVLGGIVGISALGAIEDEECVITPKE